MRKTYLLEQKQNHNRKVLAVLPILYPKEILTAMNILAVEIWGPPGIMQNADSGRIQTYICPIVRNALSFITGGKTDDVDGILFPHTCDSIQGLTTVLYDFGSLNKPLFVFIHPKGADRESTRKYLKQEMKDLAKELEKITKTPLEMDTLSDAIKLHRQIDTLRNALICKRAYSPLSDRELFSLLRRGEYLWPSDHLLELQEAVQSLSKEKVQTGIPIMMSGIVPEPMSIYDNINEAGAYVVADDYAAIGRRIVDQKTIEFKDPFDALVELYFKTPPCSTRSQDMNLRRDHINSMIEKSGAKGLVIHNVKFCEPEMFDYPFIKKSLAEKNIPHLYMESELEAELTGQTITRLEAFIEMASSKRG